MKKLELTLDDLFDSPIRVRLLKLFLFNPEQNFDGKTVAKMLNMAPVSVKKHLKKLLKTGFIVAKKISNKPVFKTNKNFILLNELKELIVRANLVSKEKMLARFKNFGGIKLAALSGIFLNLDNSYADLLVVGDKINSAKFDRFLKELEAEAGREINCALMTTKEFYYRYDMHDRFLRDILDFKHEKLINKLKL